MSVIVGTYCRRHVERAFPVGLRNHFQHHHFALVDGAFAFERDVHHIGNGISGNHHAGAFHGFLVHCHYDTVGREDLQVRVVVQDPVPDDVLQLVRVVAQHLFQVFRTVFVIVDDLLEGIGLHGDAFARTGDVLQTGPTDGQRRRVVGRTAHLVNVPVGLQVTQVADTGIGTHAFRFLVVPQREGVVVTVGEDHRIALGVQVVLSEVTAGVASAAVVVVPRLSGHLYGDKQGEQTD